jgi:DNA-directed RNA polymerase specialized sigma subunit
LHARDHLDPRIKDTAPDAPRLRKSQRLSGPSLHAPVQPGDDTRWDEVLATPADDADCLAAQWLARQLGRLDARTAWIVRRYFWEDVGMSAIADELGLTASRISYIITAALQALRRGDPPGWRS